MKNQEEVWLPIKGYEGIYEVSNLGRVKSKVQKKDYVLKQSLTTTGYYRVNLHKDRKQKTKKVHQLVAIAFLNHTPCGFKLIVDHINNIKTDNRLVNLQLVTNRYNSSKDKKNGTSKYIGVSWNKALRKWHSSIQIKGVENHLGYFENELDAHKSYKKKLSEIKEYKQKKQKQ